MMTPSEQFYFNIVANLVYKVYFKKWFTTYKVPYYRLFTKFFLFKSSPNQV